jgi:hypothetical protein
MMATAIATARSLWARWVQGATAAHAVACLDARLREDIGLPPADVGPPLAISPLVKAWLR